MTQAARRRFDEARLAVMFLTRLPVGTLHDPVPSLADARWAFPLVGLILGAAAWAVQQGALMAGFDPLPAALLCLGTVAALTGGLHHDGLADFADGIGGGRDREHCLEIMRDSRIGSYGVLALIFVVGFAATSLASFSAGAPLALFLMLAVGSRLAMLMVLDLVPPARDNGLGHGASAKNGAAWVLGLAVLAALAALTGPAILLILCAVAFAAFVIAWRAKRRIGGQTGDVLGAVQITSETFGWLLAAAFFAI